MHFDVIVVGAGVTGSSLSLNLSQEGLNVGLLDYKNPYVVRKSDIFNGRTAALNSTSWNFLKKIGLSTTQATLFNNIEVWDSRGSSRISFSAEEIDEKNLGAVVSNNTLMFDLKNPVLSSDKIEFIEGELEEIKHDEDVVKVSLKDGKNFTATLLVGSDGANSTVRNLSGIKTKSWSYEQRALVASLKSEMPHLNSAKQLFNEEGIIALLPYDEKEGSNISLVWSLNIPKSEEVLSLDKKSIEEKLYKDTEGAIGHLQLNSELRSFPLYQMHALDYFCRRAVIVGEAAHTIHPLAGQGLNISLMDVNELSERVISERRKGNDIGSEGNLRSYQKSRQIHNMGMAGMMEAFKRGFETDNPWLKLARNTAFDIVQDSKDLKKGIIKRAIGFI